MGCCTVLFVLGFIGLARDLLNFGDVGCVIVSVAFVYFKYVMFELLIVLSLTYLLFYSHFFVFVQDYLLSSINSINKIAHKTLHNKH
jgi:hypothetical protein